MTLRKVDTLFKLFMVLRNDCHSGKIDTLPFLIMVQFHIKNRSFIITKVGKVWLRENNSRYEIPDKHFHAIPRRPLINKYLINKYLNRQNILHRGKANSHPVLSQTPSNAGTRSPRPRTLRHVPAAKMKQGRIKVTHNLWHKATVYFRL